MTDSLYYFLVSLGLVLLISGSSLIGIMFYKGRQAPVNAPSGIIDTLYENRMASYIAGTIMVLAGISCIGLPIYFPSNRMSLRG